MITNRTIKEAIKNKVEEIDQWLDAGHLGIAYDLSLKLTVLIELLEIDNCGSVGGLDKGQAIKGNSDSIDGLKARAKWVLSK